MSNDSTIILSEQQEHTGRVFRLQFDEFQIVSSSHDDTILIWDFLNYNQENNDSSNNNNSNNNQASITVDPARSPSREFLIRSRIEMKNFNSMKKCFLCLFFSM